MEKFAEIVSFIRKTYNKPEGFIALHEPTFKGNEKKYLEECIDSTFVSSVGKFVDKFEEQMAQYTGSKKAVVSVNGTNALHMALILLGVKPDEEVITQPLTFIATANAISYCDANPVFIDVDRDTLGLSPDALSKWLDENSEIKLSQDHTTKQAYNKNTGRRIAACVPMHTFGHPCRIDKIMELCNSYHIEVVEDAAESLGSYFKNQHTGIFSKIGILSFNGNKTITTGGGGMLLFNDEELAKSAKYLTTQAKVPHPWKFVHDEIGYNYRMPNINAALGVAQLEQLPGFLNAKRKIAEEYNTFFKTQNIQFVKEPENSKSNYWLNALLLNNRKERDEFLEYTNKNGIMTRPIWELMNKLKMYRDCECGDLTNAEWLEERVVNIPSSVRF